MSRWIAAAAAAIIVAGNPLVASAQDKAVTTWGTWTENKSVKRLLGSGRLVRQSRPVAPFTAIDATGVSNIEITVGERPSVEVEADDNIVHLIGTQIESGVLRIGTHGDHLVTSAAPRVRVTVPTLERASLVGSGNATIRGLRGGELILNGSGSGRFAAGGRLDRLRVKLSGSGGTDFAQLNAADVHIEISGTGDSHVRATQSLSAIVNGAAHLTYSGNPQRVSQRVSGPSTIEGVKPR